MDLNAIGSALKSSQAQDMHLLAPDGSPLYAYQHPEKGWQVTTDRDLEGHELFPCLFKMIGIDSKAFRERKAANFNRAQKQRGKVKFSEAEMEAFETVASGVTGWSHIVWNEAPSDPESKGFLIEHDFDNVMKVIMGYPPCFDQADRFISDRANFFDSASTS